MHTARGLLGSPRRLTQGCFHPQVIDGYCIPFPRNLSTSSSSSLCSPLQSPFASAPRSTYFDASFTCLGFPPSSRHHSSAATFHAGSHACATFRPPVFSTARRFTPRPSLQAYSIPQPRPGSLPFRGFSPRAATCSSSDGVPPPLVRTKLTDLRRLPLDPVLDFEAFIHARPRSPWLRYSQRHAPLPSSGSSPPGPHFQQLIAVTCDAPLTTSAPCTFAFAIAPGARPQRISGRKPDGHVSVPPACSSFRAVSPNPPCDFTSAPSARLPA